jgi:hypothetical protein
MWMSTVIRVIALQPDVPRHALPIGGERTNILRR